MRQNTPPQRSQPRKQRGRQSGPGNGDHSQDNSRGGPRAAETPHRHTQPTPTRQVVGHRHLVKPTRQPNQPRKGERGSRLTSPHPTQHKPTQPHPTPSQHNTTQHNTNQPHITPPSHTTRRGRGPPSPTANKHTCIAEQASRQNHHRRVEV